MKQACVDQMSLVNCSRAASVGRNRHHAMGRWRGFTLVELIVVVSITVVMLLAVSQVFTHTQEAVSLGVATSDVLTNARTVNSTFVKDATEMVGPNEGGFIVILNKQYPNLPGGTAAEFHMTADDEAQGNTDVVRSDQLVFIRNRGELESLCPANGYTVSNTYSRAPYAKVWYGHLLRTEPNGNSRDLTISHPATDYLPLPINGNTTHAIGLILGRHALHLSHSTPSSWTEGSHYNAEIEGWGSDGKYIPSSIRMGPTNDPYIFQGLADVAHMGLTHNARYGALVGTAPLGADEPNNETPGKSDYRLYPIAAAADLTHVTAIQYKRRAYQFTYGVRRLEVNPVPQLETHSDSPYKFDSWQFAQMHPYLAGHVSYFEVTVALDLDGDDQPDKDTNDEIKWFDGITHESDLTTASFAPYDDDPEYQPRHPSGNPVGSPIDLPLADKAFVFPHGGEHSGDWPFMIRIRYRMHDPQGKLGDTDGSRGRWFEQIIQVNRD